MLKRNHLNEKAFKTKRKSSLRKRDAKTRDELSIGVERRNILSAGLNGYPPAEQPEDELLMSARIEDMQKTDPG